LGKKSLEEVQEEFLSFLPVVNGEVTREEFLAFYDDVNINFAHNDVFLRYVSSQWHYTPQKKQAAREEQIRAAIKALRYKLIEKSQGTKDELLIRKLFSEFDKNNNFYLTANDLNRMVKSFSIEADPSVTEAVHERIDKNSSGYI
jgi:Ca2+-binding EF-hand superfamily protein